MPMDTASLNYRWQQQSNHRYSPYPHYSHRVTYMPMAPRYNPSNPVQYPTVPSNVDYGTFTGSSNNVDWTRSSYVQQYPTYGEVEDTVPYPSQAPPPYILPNTDPMSTTNAYYVNAQGIRPQPATVWSEHQQTLPQQSSHLPVSAYAVSTETAQPFHSLSAATCLPPDRILPHPARGSNYIAAATPSLDTLAIASQNQRSSYCWNNEAVASGQQLPTHLDVGGARDQSGERKPSSYRIQDLPYSHMTMSDALSTTPISNGLSTGVIEARTSPADSATEEAQSQRSTVRTVSSDSLRTSSENTSVAHGYTSAMAGRGLHPQQVRSRLGSGQLANGLLYCRTQQPVVPRREQGSSDDCSPDCTNCPTDSSTRSSFTSASNVSSTY